MGMDKELLRIKNDAFSSFGDVFEVFSADPVIFDMLRSASVLIADAFAGGGKLLICGNGGSAADSQHMAAEYIVRLHADDQRRPLPAIALTTDTSNITACANDLGFEKIFERQVRALGSRNDVFLGISTSGRSENIVLAADAAAESDMKTILLTGPQNTPSSPTVQIKVQGNNVRDIQMLHLFCEHIIVEMTLYLLSERGYI